LLTLEVLIVFDPFNLHFVIEVSRIIALERVVQNTPSQLGGW
jgi:hypothetical protein